MFHADSPLVLSEISTICPSNFEICPENAHIKKLDHFIFPEINYTHICKEKQIKRITYKQSKLQVKRRMKNG